MTFSSEFNSTVRFLYHLNLNKDCPSLHHNHLVLERKRTCLKNFLHWFIHLITFTLVPRNKKLDTVTHHILSKLKEINDPPKGLSDQEKFSLSMPL
ncbi:MAG: hypothetical protein HWD61_15080 [Parachlamydiaceae bacterium]|nr:MAG: hypothetical protein HWD61_15080 [Parachlamydiaceae bacterium]